jgi:hypothetical protein
MQKGRSSTFTFGATVRTGPQARKQLKELGWAKGLELAKLARRDRIVQPGCTKVGRCPKSSSSRRSKGN